MRLHIDFEVYSEVNIREAPLDVYASHPSTKIILCAWALDEGEVFVYEPDARSMPTALKTALRSTDTTLVAWNTGYERTVLKYKGLDIPIKQWLDPMVLARYAGLPGKLKDCAKIPMIGVPEEAATKSETLLIKKFCMPGGKGKLVEREEGGMAMVPDGAGPRVMPSEFPEDWALFVEYCRKDVMTMRHVLNWIEPRFPFPARERRLWEIDQTINERGLPVDVEMARHGMKETARITVEAFDRLKVLTGLENPNSVTQLHPWLQERGYKYDSLGKEFLQQALDIDSSLPVEQKTCTIHCEKGNSWSKEGVRMIEPNRLHPDAREVIEVRLSAAKASVKKFQVIAEMASPEAA